MSDSDALPPSHGSPCKLGSEPSSIPVTFPEKLAPLFSPCRYKVAEGGRGGAKSWNFARALLIMGTQRPLRVLCAREYMKSIEDSVHRLLSDQITALGLQAYYEIEKKGIKGSNGTLFFFEGIKNNPGKIKSYEGVDICWVEEAAKVSKASWNVLIPTIRKDGSEIWLSFNVDLETDYTWQRFVVGPRKAAAEGKPDTSIWHVKMSWRDNPWFTPTMEAERLALETSDPDEYLNVWEGHPRTALEGAVYGKELRAALAEGRIGRVPIEPAVPINTYWDLGRADNTAIWFKQKVGFEHRVVDYYEATNETIPHFLKVLQQRGYLFGSHTLPHDAEYKTLAAQQTIRAQVETRYPRSVFIAPKLRVEDGINAARTFMANCWFDEERCVDGINSLRNYKYRIIDGQRSNLPLHDWASDGADAFRYMATADAGVSDAPARVAEKLMRGLSAPVKHIAGGLGWMG